MQKDELETSIRQRYLDLCHTLTERQRRLWAAAEAKALGYGGVSLIAKVTGVSRRAIHVGLTELAAGAITCLPAHRTRRQGAGRKPVTQLQPDILSALEKLVEPTSRGDPESSLRYNCLSVRNLTEQLQAQGFRIARQCVSELLRQLGYSLQANRKTREGTRHPDRNAQFEYVAKQVKSFQTRRQPAISVDTKKKELVGDYKNAGREWRPKSEPEPVRVHDFVDKQLGKAIPYGVYDLSANTAWVSVGIDHDTAEFAVETIRRWWKQMGKEQYKNATELLITADGGGSNTSRCRLWKWSLQKLANETNLSVRVCHYPPRTSKWNKIEHRLFSYIAMNWRGRPLVSREEIVRLISQTKTKTGLAVKAELDSGLYPTGIKITDEQFAAIRLHRESFHGEWNYTIKAITTD